MRISDATLNSRIGRSIALMLLVAALVPTLLMTILSINKINALFTNYEHQALIEKSRGYALNVFSNLIYARSNLKHRLRTATPNQEQIVIELASREVNMFRSITELMMDGQVINSSTNAKEGISQETLLALKALELEQDIYKLLITPSKKTDSKPTISIVTYRKKNPLISTFLIAELEPNYLWGDKRDYPLDAKLCAYQMNASSKTNLFCSNQEKTISLNSENNWLNHGEWELFLRAEFGSSPWLFSVDRVQPITPSHLKEFVGNQSYIGIAILSMLVIGLLTLIQIRKTIKPLEGLMLGTKKIAEGDFSPVNVTSNTEFSDLATSFNDMSARIKRQLETLQSFSSIDKEIGTKIDIKQTIDLIITRMQHLQPCGIFCIAYQEESSEQEGQFNCTIGGHESLTNVRLSLTAKEINKIKQYGDGQFKQSSLKSNLVHERLMAELGTHNIWVLPIFWQGELCAFLSAGCKTELDFIDAKLSILEFRELATRIGIVISAHQREQKLLTEAQYDNLTGLPNRILLQDRLKQAMEHADRTGSPLWVVFVDLDRFKDVNDSLGHATGDTLLAELGCRLKGVIRETDTVARFGGDEFVLVLSGDPGDSTQLSLLNRIMNAISEPVQVNNHELMNTCSIGISIYPTDSKSPEGLIKNADIAMYRAKELGKNNYQFFTQRLNDQAAERMKLISLLRKAIANNEFTLHYQPKVDLTLGQVVGLEALIRWNNPILGNVSPAKFIPVAEEAGLITSIGDWVLTTACKQIAIWQKTGLGNLLISVNISAKQFHQDDFAKKLKSILIETSAKAECLELELTESLLMTDSDKSLNTLHAIKSMGIKLSIDDFGTGYSNLSYLGRLPIDTLKIDKAFIDSINLTTDSAPIVNTIINLAKNMNLKVVAEGTETLDQILYLKANHCDQIQGYYFSKPLPANEIKELIMSGKKLDLPKLKLVENTAKKT